MEANMPGEKLLALFILALCFFNATAWAQFSDSVNLDADIAIEITDIPSS
jgi:hypothetical protein